MFKWGKAIGPRLKFFLKSGFRKNMVCPNVSYNPATSVRIVFHGDDFLSAGPEKEVEELRKMFGGRFEAKHATIGPR